MTTFKNILSVKTTAINNNDDNDDNCCHNNNNVNNLNSIVGYDISKVIIILDSNQLRYM